MRSKPTRPRNNSCSETRRSPSRNSWTCDETMTMTPRGWATSSWTPILTTTPKTRTKPRTSCRRCEAQTRPAPKRRPKEGTCAAAEAGGYDFNKVLDGQHRKTGQCGGKASQGAKQGKRAGKNVPTTPSRTDPRSPSRRPAGSRKARPTRKGAKEKQGKERQKGEMRKGKQCAKGSPKGKGRKPPKKGFSAWWAPAKSG